MYSKLFSSMFDGSLATRGPWEALVTFQQMLVLADRYGHVDMTAAVIARRTTIPEHIIVKGLTTLALPDPGSRRDNEEGRRIVLLDPGRSWGWRIVNYAHYHAIRTAEERRDYQREYMRERRAAGKDKARPKGNGAESTKTPDEPLVAPDWLDLDKWTAWMAIRPARARTTAAKRAALAQLESFRAAGHDANAIIAKSLANGWQGLVAPDGKAHGNQAPSSTPANRPCDYCGAKSTGQVNGYSHCQAHMDAAMFHEQPPGRNE